jgi:NADPH-dependent 7-cyano-7-deazaguanine reductase QueF-like protein
MYIKRNQVGAIVAISQIATDDISEFVGEDSTELQLYLLSLKSLSVAALEQTDQAMARVLEDVINLLVDQGTIRFTDLPEAAQTKLLSRRELRGQRQGMDLLDDGDHLNI